jgi:molybdate transport system substrate-binding protein
VSIPSWFPLAYRKARLTSALLACLALFSATTFASAQKQLRIAAAADLQPVMPVLSQLYEQKTGVKLLVSYGSSGTLTTQILNGGPFDLFLAADFVHPEQIVAASLADSSVPTAYAKGTLVLWTRKDSGLLPLSLDRLTDPRVTRIAIANELHAPYGFAAAQALRKLKLYDQLKPRLVIGENIAQTAQFVESGNAQLGFLSLTTASTEHFKQIGEYVLIPTSQYPEIRQCAVILAKSDHKAEAHQFLDWLLSPPVQSGLGKLGLASVR